jgi:hypothetical protein
MDIGEPPMEVIRMNTKQIVLTNDGRITHHNGVKIGSGRWGEWAIFPAEAAVAWGDGPKVQLTPGEWALGETGQVGRFSGEFTMVVVGHEPNGYRRPRRTYTWCVKLFGDIVLRDDEELELDYDQLLAVIRQKMKEELGVIDDYTHCAEADCTWWGGKAAAMGEGCGIAAGQKGEIERAFQTLFSQDYTAKKELAAEYLGHSDALECVEFDEEGQPDHEVGWCEHLSAASWRLMAAALLGSEENAEEARASIRGAKETADRISDAAWAVHNRNG